MSTISQSRPLPKAMPSAIPHSTSGLRRNLPVRHRRLPWIVAIVLVWMERAEQRRNLAQLDERELSDIGVTRAQALAEAAKPFWRP